MIKLISSNDILTFASSARWLPKDFGVRNNKLEDISLIILDECHHTHDKNPYNEIMTYYRIEKYGKNSRKLPQV
jgi:ERCC4-related helicase